MLTNCTDISIEFTNVVKKVSTNDINHIQEKFYTAYQCAFEQFYKIEPTCMHTFFLHVVPV